MKAGLGWAPGGFRTTATFELARRGVLGLDAGLTDRTEPLVAASLNKGVLGLQAGAIFNRSRKGVTGFVGGAIGF